MGERKQSGGQPASALRSVDSEYIGPQIDSSNLPISRVLDGSPPLGTESSFAIQPVPNSRLLDAGPVQEFSDPASQLGLASADIDGAFERDDVRRFAHEPEGYTRILVNVNKNGCFPVNKDPCKVLYMTPARAKKQVQPKKAPKKASVGIGPDGLTLGQRLHRLMADRVIGQTELARMCSEYYAAFVPTSEDKFKQQHIFNVLQGQNTAEVLPIIAAVLDVSPLWLQLGIGNRETSKS